MGQLCSLPLEMPVDSRARGASDGISNKTYQQKAVPRQADPGVELQLGCMYMHIFFSPM